MGQFQKIAYINAWRIWRRIKKEQSKGNIESNNNWELSKTTDTKHKSRGNRQHQAS